MATPIIHSKSSSASISYGDIANASLFENAGRRSRAVSGVSGDRADGAFVADAGCAVSVLWNSYLVSTTPQREAPIGQSRVDAVERSRSSTTG